MILDYLKTLPQYVVPQQLLSYGFGKFAALSQPPWLKNCAIKKFIRRYGVDMSEAAQSQPESYENFNQFFTRRLLEGTRPIAREPKTIISPADGTISEMGQITKGRLLQAKGHSYQLIELLAGNTSQAAYFLNGSFATIYLAPKDYHRVHMPLDGQLQEMCHVPGKLFSVNFRTAKVVSRLFARNERVITLFRTPVGFVAVILVGAMIVASIGTSWAGLVTPPRQKRIRSWHYHDLFLNKADDLGYFQLGSTVILLFQPDAINWQTTITSGQTVRMGQAIATFGDKPDAN